MKLIFISKYWVDFYFEIGKCFIAYDIIYETDFTHNLKKVKQNVKQVYLV
jgi:hypothetical protein